MPESMSTWGDPNAPAEDVRELHALLFHGHGSGGVLLS